MKKLSQYVTEGWQHHLSAEVEVLPLHYSMVGTYSCTAVRNAILYDECMADFDTYNRLQDLYQEFENFITEAGLINHRAVTNFDDLPRKERQNARALWLMWVAMILEEEGK